MFKGLQLTKVTWITPLEVIISHSVIIKSEMFEIVTNQAENLS